MALFSRFPVVALDCTRNKTQQNTQAAKKGLFFTCIVCEFQIMGNGNIQECFGGLFTGCIEAFFSRKFAVCFEIFNIGALLHGSKVKHFVESCIMFAKFRPYVGRCVAKVRQMLSTIVCLYVDILTAMFSHSSSCLQKYTLIYQYIVLSVS